MELISPDKFVSKNNKPKNKNIELKTITPIDINKEDLVSKYQNKKPSDDSSLNSAAYSQSNLKHSQNVLQQSIKTLKTENINDRYLRKKYELTLRREALKYFTEREKIQKKYEERNSYIHLFDNNPQFTNIIKKTEKQLLYLLIHIITIIIYESIINFDVGNGQLGFVMCSFMLAIISFIFCIIVFLALKIKFLNDPNLSRGFRFIVILTFFIYIITYCFNIATFIITISTLKEKFVKSFRWLTYLMFLITVILLFPTMHKGFFLFVESVLIFFKKKTEYSVLILNEQNNLSASQTNDNNTNANLITFNNNLNLNLNKNLVNNNYDNDQNFNNYNYYSKFHASVTYRDSAV